MVSLVRQLFKKVNQSTRRPVAVLGSLLLLVITTSCSGVVEIVRVNVTPAAAVPVGSQDSDKAVLPVSNLTAGIPIRITAKTIDLDAPVVEMGWQLEEQAGQVFTTWLVPENEAGWHRNSARPGDGSNIVISGHNNSLGGQVFGELEELEVGDQVTLWTDQETSFIYQVREKRLVRTLAASEEALEFLEQAIGPTSQEQLTLITCWPNWTNTHRLILFADLQSKEGL